MKQKKTILLCCTAVMLLLVMGAGIALFSGCRTAGSGEETQRDTATGDQITEAPSPDRETDTAAAESEANTRAPETDEVKNPEESQAPSTEATADESEPPREPDTEDPEGNDKSETDSEDTAGGEPTTDPEFPDFAEYSAMSAEEQEAFFRSFDSPADFFVWYNAAKEKYQEEHPDIEIGPDGIIPLP
jgi:hypothetical protein